MRFKRTPVKGQYVVLISDEIQAAQKFSDTADFFIEPVFELVGAYIARSKDADTPEAALHEKLRVIFGKECRIQSLLEDEEGHVFVPTGKINVKATEALRKIELNAWIERHHLKLINQSKWMPETVTVTLDDNRADIDQVLQNLEHDPTVDIAEPDVLTRFTRESVRGAN
ncbi:MAG: hypothetical protein AAGA53_12610 [Pseudomonadota bacterium]